MKDPENYVVNLLDLNLLLIDQFEAGTMQPIFRRNENNVRRLSSTQITFNLVTPVFVAPKVM